MSNHPTLVLTLGWPSKPEQRPVFDRYQQFGHFGEGPKLWEELEGKVVKMLFDREAHKTSLIEELFSKLGGIPLRINDHYPAFGMHRGFWVATIAISGGVVVTPEGEGAPWPPQRECCTQAVSCLAQVLGREWVHWSVVPAIGRSISLVKPSPKP